MNSEKLREWAINIRQPTKSIGLRDGRSIHQEKALELLALIEKAKRNPSMELYDKFREYKPISCPEKTGDHVEYLDYLQKQVLFELLGVKTVIEIPMREIQEHPCSICGKTDNVDLYCGGPFTWLCSDCDGIADKAITAYLKMIAHQPLEFFINTIKDILKDEGLEK